MPPHRWQCHKFRLRDRSYRDLQIQRTQSPLVQGSACTTTKAQGQTYHSLNANSRLPGQKGRPGSTYVVCSRVTSMDRLALVDLAADQPTYDTAVHEAMTALLSKHNLRDTLLSRSARQCVQRQHTQAKTLTVATWNCYTLNPAGKTRLPDASADDTLTFADVVCFCETKLCSDDDVFSCAAGEKVVVAHCPARVARKNRVGGTMLQARPGHRVTERHSHSCASGIDIAEAIIAPPQEPETRIIGVYNSPSHTCDPLTCCLSGLLHAPLQTRTIVPGDFNVDLTSELPPQRRMTSQLQAFMAARGLMQVVTAGTHRRGGLIDRHHRRIRQRP